MELIELKEINSSVNYRIKNIRKKRTCCVYELFKNKSVPHNLPSDLTNYMCLVVMPHEKRNSNKIMVKFEYFLY